MSISKPTYKRTYSIGSLFSIILGLLLFLLSRDTDGFVGGMGQGAGVMLILLGVVGLAMSRRSDGNTWLPSRDGDR